MSESLNSLQSKKVKLEGDKGKPIEYLFDEGVRLIFLPEGKVSVEFSVLGLAFNDLLRFIPVYNLGTRINHEENFVNRAITYIQAIFPDLRVKRYSQMQVKADGGVHFEIWVQKFPSDIGRAQFEKNLPYAGNKSQNVDMKGYGLGEKGNGFMYKGDPDSVDKKETNQLEDMTSSWEDFKNPTLDDKKKDKNKKDKKSAPVVYRLKESNLKPSEYFLKTYFEEVPGIDG